MRRSDPDSHTNTEPWVHSRVDGMVFQAQFPEGGSRFPATAALGQNSCMPTFGGSAEAGVCRSRWLQNKKNCPFFKATLNFEGLLKDFQPTCFCPFWYEMFQTYRKMIFFFYREHSSNPLPIFSPQHCTLVVLSYSNPYTTLASDQNYFWMQFFFRNFSLFLFILLSYSWFTMLCQFLLYSKVT